MERIPEPELMNDAEQARAYSEADFSEPHNHFVQLMIEKMGSELRGEALDLGRHAIAMSRATGLWSAVKIVADVADASASVDLHPDLRPQVDNGHFGGLDREAFSPGRHHAA